MGFLTKKKTTKLTEKQRKELMQSVDKNLTDEELILLEKALKNKMLKTAAIKELRQYI